MPVLLLCLAWNAMHGIVLVKLLEGGLLSLVTLSENSHFQVQIFAVLYRRNVVLYTRIWAFRMTICYSDFYFYFEKTWLSNQWLTLVSLNNPLYLKREGPCILLLYHVGKLVVLIVNNGAPAIFKINVTNFGNYIIVFFFLRSKH